MITNSNLEFISPNTISIYYEKNQVEIMPSISSKKSIRNRVALKLKPSIVKKSNSDEVIHSFLKELMEEEYQIIPEKERIGKGSVFIAKTIGLQCYKWLIRRISQDYAFWNFIDDMIQKGEDEKDRNLYNLGLILFAQCMCESEENTQTGFKLLEKYATHSNWEIREMAGYSIRQCIKIDVEGTINALWPYVDSNNEKLRRIVSESLRPLADIHWLRDPTRNDLVLELLTAMRADPSMYVRKSVGNNLKDLTKYMPKKILSLFETWSVHYNLKISDDLASKTKKELGEEQFYFVWMMKHALRWLRERNPEFHPQITELLGKNYVRYFDEKKNRLAKPPK